MHTAHTHIYATIACLSAACFVRFPVKPKDCRETGSVCVCMCVCAWAGLALGACPRVWLWYQSWWSKSFSPLYPDTIEAGVQTRTHIHRTDGSTQALVRSLSSSILSLPTCIYFLSSFGSTQYYWCLLICLSVLMHFYLFCSFIHEKNSYSQTFFDACPTGVQPTNPSKYNLDFCLCTRSVII